MPDDSGEGGSFRAVAEVMSGEYYAQADLHLHGILEHLAKGMEDIPRVVPQEQDLLNIKSTNA